MIHFVAFVILPEGFPPDHPRKALRLICTFQINDMSTFEQRLGLALLKTGLREEVEREVIGICSELNVSKLANLTEQEVRLYVRSSVLAAWVECSNEMGESDLDRGEMKSELLEHVLADVARLLRVKHLKSLT